jgi:myo-inositol 2-dehydrogenase/D-chiro-inositol 1-dehydrogenase
MAVFRLGLIGAGRMGRTHMRALTDSESVRVAAVAEPSAQRRQLCAGSDLRLHGTAEAMLDAGGIDGVLIAAPTKGHLGLVEQTLARGLPVLCEKPCGASPEEAGRAAALAGAAGRPLQIAYWRRFVPVLRRLRERIAAGAFGDIYLITCYQWDGEAPPASFRVAGGGIFVDMGVHEFDQLRWLTGQDVTELHAVPADVSANPVAGEAESAQVLCRLSGGSNGFVSLGRRFPEGDVCWAQIFGTRHAEKIRFLWPPDAERIFLRALRDQAESFARYAIGGPREGAEAADAVAALQVAQTASRVLKQSMETT